MIYITEKAIIEMEQDREIELAKISLEVRERINADWDKIYKMFFRL